MKVEPSRERLVELLRLITETPAPTFGEGARRDLLADLLRAAGASVSVDEIGNVVAELPGDGPVVVVAAHLDTVFPADTDVRVRSKGENLTAPGIGDNSASLAVLAHWIERMGARSASGLRVVAACTVGEEGLGDLRGARHLVAARPPDMFVALDGHLGTIVARGVGSRRFEIRFRGPGGHSWGDFGSPSAVHALGDAIHALNRMPVPAEPRSAFNVGTVEGGRSVNAIAEEACFRLDLRSLDAETLDRLAREALARVEHVAHDHGVTVEARQVGHRPAASSDNAPMVRAAKRALTAVGVRPRVVASSTDANAAMAAGVPAIGFGVYRGGDAHRHSEWLERDSLTVGFQALDRLLTDLGSG